MNKIYCSNCGQLIAGDAKFCTYCGVQQHGADARFRAQDAPVASVEALAPEAHDIVPVAKSHLDARAIWLFFFGYFGKTSILIPALIVGAVLYPQLFLPLLGAVVAIMFLTALLVYNNFQYEIDPTGLVIESGVIHKKRVSVPFEQIQNVNIERSLIDRVLGLARISIETAGSSNANPQTVADVGKSVKSEGYLPGIDLEKAKVLHDTLIDGASDAV